MSFLVTQTMEGTGKYLIITRCEQTRWIIFHEFLRRSDCFLGAGCFGMIMMRWPEQKSVNWIMDLILKFCKAGKVIVDTSSGTVATAKAVLQLLQHRHFVEY